MPLNRANYRKFRVIFQTRKVDIAPCFLEIGRSSFLGHGALAQLVEHIPFKDGVDGSSPSRATTFRRNLIVYGSPSSSGLGHYPFTVDTGVQIPLGTPFRWAEVCSSFDFATHLHATKPHR
jgi:hypothetical protein